MATLQPDSLRKHRQTVLRETTPSSLLQLPQGDFIVDEVDRAKVKSRISSVQGGLGHRTRANSIQRIPPHELIDESVEEEEGRESIESGDVNAGASAAAAAAANATAGYNSNNVNPYAQMGAGGAGGRLDVYSGAGVGVGSVDKEPRSRKASRSGLEKAGRDGVSGREHGRGERDKYTREGAVKQRSDGSEFRSEDFDAKRFISRKLGDKTDVEIAKYADKLALLQDKLNSEREQVMYDNYQTFLKVGFKIDKMNTDIEVLRKSLNDLHHVTSAMREDAKQYLDKQHNGSLTNTFGGGEPNDLNNSTSSLGTEDGMLDGPTRVGVQNRALQLSNRVANNRSSVLMLEDMWQRDLKELFRHVDGAQRYLPIVPGRHVVTQQDGFYYLNNATWKPLYPVQIFVLSDHVLIGAKKRQKQDGGAAGGGALGAPPSASASARSNGGAGGLSVHHQHQTSSRNLVAENCWPILDIEMSGAQQNGSRRPAICITHGDNVYMYRSENPAAHAAILTTFGKCKQELMQLQAAAAASRSGKAGKRNNSGASSSSIGARGSSLRSSVISAGDKKTLKQYEAIISDLDLKIAYGHTKEAVGIVLQYYDQFKSVGGTLQTTTSASASSIPGLSFNLGHSAAAAAATPTETGGRSSSSTTGAGPVTCSLLDKLNQRITVISDLLVTELERSYNSRQTSANIVQLLRQLRAKDIAARVLLETRHNILKKRVKQVEFQGDTVEYVSQVAIITFRTIKTSIDLFKECFQDSKEMSAVVEWAKTEVDEQFQLFKRHISNLAAGSVARQQCCDVIRREARRLASSGVDFSFVYEYAFLS